MIMLLIIIIIIIEADTTPIECAVSYYLFRLFMTTMGSKLFISWAPGDFYPMVDRF